jgi:hypothetical protein
MTHHAIESLTITGGRHFPTLHLEFSERLNVLIGTRGTGKSGILNYILFGLGTPVPPLYANFVPGYDAYLHDNLGAGKVTLKVRTQHGAVYTSTRSYGEPARVYGPDGTLADVTLAGELFRADAYAQGSLEEIGRTPAAILALVDRCAEAEVRRLEGALAAIERRIEQNAAERERLAAETGDDEAQAAELPQVAEALKALALPGGPDPAAIERAGAQRLRRGAERGALEELAKGTGLARAGLGAYVTGALAQLGAGVHADLEQGAHPQSAEVLRRAHAAVDHARAAIEGAARTVGDALAGTEQALAAYARELAQIHAKEDEEYHALVVQQDADRHRAAERERLHRRFEELSAVARRLDARKRDLGDRTTLRARLAEDRNALLLELSELRARVARECTAALRDEVRVILDRASDSEAARALLGEMTKGHNLRGSFLDDVAKGIRPRALLAAVEANNVAAIEAVDTSATGKTARAVKLLAALAGSDKLRALETVRLGDVATLALNVDGAHQPADRVSIGQRCTCVLPLVLLESVAVLLLDQPEDHVDNAYVHDVLIPMLLARKQKRQIIVASLNPNIPVLGEAERIFALAGGTWSGRVDAAGNVDEMKRWIETYLEGGRAAFRKRAERYGHVLAEER